MSEKLHSLLTIAGTDPLGGAGIHADIRVGISMGLHVMSAITCVTVQNSKGVFAISPVAPEILQAQLDSIFEEVLPDAIKIGIIGSDANFLVISNFLKNIPREIPVIIDPVLNASANGIPFSIDKTILTSNYLDYIFPYASVITPNFRELEEFLDKTININNINQIILNQLKVEAIVITGLEQNNEIIDFLLINNNLIKTQHKKIDCHNLHGTGCAFSSFLASLQAIGLSLKDAFLIASNKMVDVISKSYDYSLGNCSYGPLNLNNYKL